MQYFRIYLNKHIYICNVKVFNLKRGYVQWVKDSKVSTEMGYSVTISLIYVYNNEAYKTVVEARNAFIPGSFERH